MSGDSREANDTGERERGPNDVTGTRPVETINGTAGDSVAPSAKQSLDDEVTPSVSSSASSVTLVQDILSPRSNPPSPVLQDPYFPNSEITKFSKSAAAKGTKQADFQDGTTPKPSRGWPGRPPFIVTQERDWVKTQIEKYTYWGDLTLKEKLEFRKSFLKLYLTETKQCIPCVRKFFMMIYRISPWRVVMLLAMNIVSGLLPALTLQARGNFMSMVEYRQPFEPNL